MRALATHSDRGGVSLDNPHYRKCLADLFLFLGRSDRLQVDAPDPTTALCTDKPYRVQAALIMAKEDGIIAGCEEVMYLAAEGLLPWNISFNFNDGAKIRRGEILATVKAPLASLLGFERITLNLLQRFSGIATQTAKLRALLPAGIGEKVLLCPTRKTLWGLLDKKAVLVGGGGTHRLSLVDAILIKENHLLARGDDHSCLSDALSKTPSGSKFFEVEVETDAQARELAPLLFGHPNAVIMLDNFPLAAAATTLKWLRSNHPDLLIELSGGINAANISAYAALEPDIVSLGALTNSGVGLDLSLRVITNPKDGGADEKLPDLPSLRC